MAEIEKVINTKCDETAKCTCCLCKYLEEIKHPGAKKKKEKVIINEEEVEVDEIKVPVDFKLCKSCGVLMPLSNFYAKKGARCKQCISNQNKKFYQGHKDKWAKKKPITKAGTNEKQKADDKQEVHNS